MVWVAGPVPGKEAREGGRVSAGTGRLCGWGAGSVGVAPGWTTPCGRVSCWNTCAAASWAACWTRACTSGSVTVVAPGGRAVGSAECAPVVPGGCGENVGDGVCCESGGTGGLDVDGGIGSQDTSSGAGSSDAGGGCGAVGTLGRAGDGGGSSAGGKATGGRGCHVVGSAAGPCLAGVAGGCGVSRSRYSLSRATSCALSPECGRPRARQSRERVDLSCASRRTVRMSGVSIAVGRNTKTD